MTAAPSWVHRMLLSAVRGELAGRLEPPPARSGWEDLAAAASFHGVHGWLARELRGETRVPGDFQVRLQATGLRVTGNHLRLLAEAAETLRVLEGAGVHSLVLKGPALVERYYEDPGLRSYGDIDVIVRPRDFEAALAALEAAGHRLADRNWEFLVEDLRGQVHLTTPPGSTVELHWHLVNGSRQRRTLRMSPDEMWDAVVPGSLGGAACLTLPAEEELAHLALHAAMHGCNRLVWLLDIAKVTRAAGPLDWDVTARRLERWGFARGGALVLELARRWVDADVPPDLGRELAGGRAMSALRWAVRTWDLGDERSRIRELFFATAGDRAGTRLELVADAIVPSPGQLPETDVPGRGALYRASLGTLRRITSKVGRKEAARAATEYVVLGDPERGRQRFLQGVRASAPEGHGREVVVLSPSPSVGMSHYARALGESIGHHARVTIVDAGRGDSVWRLARRRGSPDRRVVVTSPHWSVPLLLWKSGLSGAFVWHDPILDAANRYTKPLHRLYYRLLARRLGVVVLHGNLFKSNVAELGLRPRRLVVVPHGFVPDELVADAPYDPAGPLLFAGRLHAYKGLAVLLDAVSRLKEDPPPLVIAGDGVRHELVPETLRGVEVRPGELTDQEFRSLVERCAAVLLPYERANQSGVLATAFRSGRPVIASRVGSFEEYVKDGVNGLLVTPGDPVELAGAIRALRADEQLARSLAAGALETWRAELDPVRWSGDVVDALFD